MTTIDLRAGSELHKRVLDAICARIDMSESDMQAHHKRWDDAEKDFAFEIPERDVDVIRKTARDGGKPQYVTLNIPYTYGQMMTAHTYLSSVFLSRTPILQFSARHGQPEMNVSAVEALMDYQTQVGGHAAPYYIWLHDSVKYGLGVIGYHWDSEEHIVSDLEERPVTLAGIPIQGKTEKIMRKRRIQGYEGARLFNIRPYDVLPDTRVPLSDPQQGEFFGYKVDLTWNTIVKRGLSQQYMNVDHVKGRLKAVGSGIRDRRAAIVSEFALPGQSSTANTTHTQTSLVATIPGVVMVVELIPKEWELGSTEHPEKWVFTVLDKKVIVEARPLGLWHNRFPFETIEGEIEGYSLVKRGMLETGKPLNEVMTWLFNSHFYAVRKTLNGDWVYDPSRVVASDVMNSDGTGSRIRLRPEAYGQDVRTMLQVVSGGADVTGSHLRDTEVVGQLINRVLGVSDNITGSLNPGGRKTATEVRTASSASINRLRTMSEYMSAYGFAPLAQQLLQTTQQMYSGEKKFRIAGDSMWSEDGFVNVTPESIAGFYDYTPVDGTLPLDRFALVNMWGNLLQQVQRFPQIMQEYNMSEIFAWVAQLAGIKNIKQFRVNLVDQLSGGGLQIGGQPGGAQSGAPAARGGGNAPVIPLPNQVPGVGPSG